jgi:hypothetical protein
MAVVERLQYKLIHRQVPRDQSVQVVTENGAYAPFFMECLCFGKPHVFALI